VFVEAGTRIAFFVPDLVLWRTEKCLHKFLALKLKEFRRKGQKTRKCYAVRNANNPYGNLGYVDTEEEYMEFKLKVESESSSYFVFVLKYLYGTRNGFGEWQHYGLSG